MTVNERREFDRIKIALEKISDPDCGVSIDDEGKRHFDAGAARRIALEALGIGTEFRSWRDQIVAEIEAREKTWR